MRKSVVVTGKTLRRLIRFFPHVGEGRKGADPSPWGAWVTVDLQRPDGKVLPVRVSWDYTLWSEGNGDWEMADGFGDFLNDIFPGGEAKRG